MAEVELLLELYRAATDALNWRERGPSRAALDNLRQGEDTKRLREAIVKEIDL